MPTQRVLAHEVSNTSEQDMSGNRLVPKPQADVDDDVKIQHGESASCRS